MKKLFVLAIATMLCVACSVEENTDTTEGTNLEVVLENYKGVFTTQDGQTRGALSVELSEDNLYATGSLSLNTGEVIAFSTDQITDLGNRKQITFTSSDLSFTMTTGEEEEIMEIETVTFRGAESSILVGQNTERAPLDSIIGSYTCPTCPAPLNNLTGETFNLMIGAAIAGGNSVTSQTTLGGTTYNGVATQSGCVVNGEQTTCNLSSGTVVGVMGTAFNPGGGPVTWSGTHTFDNGASGPDNCSTVSGTWSWASNTIGTVGGAFTSNSMGDCAPPLTTITSQDFEAGTAVNYTLVNISEGGFIVEDISEASSQEDYFGRIATSNLNPTGGLDFSGFAGTRFFGANDVDGVSSIGNLADIVSINWNDLSVGAFSNINVSALFAEGDAADNGEDWDTGGSFTRVRVEYSFDNTNWTQVFSIVGDTGFGDASNTRPVLDSNNDGTPDSPVVIVDESFDELDGSFATGGNPTVSIRILIENLSGTDEDIAFDNVVISGN